MGDRPILFSAPMVRALLEGRKTQTRRVAKITAIMGNKVPVTSPDESLIELEEGEFRRGIFHYASTGALSGPYRLPYAVGSRLWVREAWRTEVALDGRRPSELDGQPIQYEADGARDFNDGWFVGRYRHARFMPRWASRLTLIVADVQVQRLQDISEEDAIAEGVEPVSGDRDERDWSICPMCGGTGLHGALGQNLGFMEVDCRECDTHIKRYRHLWDHINGPGACEANPWVAAYTFSTHRKNIDQMEASHD